MQPSPPNQNQPNLSNNIDRVGELLKGLKDSIDRAYDDVYESTVTLDEQLSTLNAKMAGTLGQTQKAIAGLRQEAAIAYPTIVGLGGDFADVQTIQQGIAEQLKTNVVTLGETVSGLYAGAKAVGISSSEIGGVVEGFQSAGIQTANIKDNMQSTVDIARRVGVNTSAVFKNVEDNLSSINKYGFQNGVDGLAKMSAQAAGLRINMNEIFGFAEKVFNPEGAVEMVSAFQRMGVAAGDLADPFRLMYLASEDTEELQNQVVKMTEKFTYFDEKSKEFKVFPNAKRDLREISNQTGIGYDELVKMSTAGQKLSMISKDFKLPGIDEESKQFIANVATYSKEKGGFTVKVSGEQKLVSQLNTNDLKELKEAQAPVSLEDLAKEQLDEATLATKTLQEIKAVLSATSAGSRGAADVRELIRGTIVSGGDAVRQSAGNVRGGIQGANKFYEETGTSLVDLMSGKNGPEKLAKVFEDSGISIQNGLKKMGDSFSNFNFEGTASKYISSGNKIAEGASAAKKKLEELMSGSKPVSSSGAIKNTGVQSTTNNQQTTNVTFNPLKVQGEINFNMKSPDGSVTKLTQSQIQQVLNSSEFQKTIQTMFKNMQTTGNYGNVPNNAGKY
jgi:hypothetical protein